MKFTADELKWLAVHWLDHNEFASNEDLPDSLNQKLKMFFKRVDGTKHYEIHEDYHSPTLHAKIKAMRKELGL